MKTLFKFLIWIIEWPLWITEWVLWRIRTWLIILRGGVNPTKGDNDTIPPVDTILPPPPQPPSHG